MRDRWWSRQSQQTCGLCACLGATPCCRVVWPLAANPGDPRAHALLPSGAEPVPPVGQAKREAETLRVQLALTHRPFCLPSSAVWVSLQAG